MVAMAVYYGFADPSLVVLSSIPKRVHILGLPLALLTPATILLVGETLGSVVNLDCVGLRCGGLVRVQIRHSLQSLVKQAFPPMNLSSLLGYLLCCGSSTIGLWGFANSMVFLSIMMEDVL